MNVKLAAAGIVSAFVLLTGLLVGMGCFGHNDTSHYQILQPVRGTPTIIDTSGYYYKGFGTVYTYPCNLLVEYPHSTNPTQDQSIKAAFNDVGTAQIGSFARVELPVSTEKRLSLHKDLKNTDNIKGSIRAYLVNLIQETAPVMSASENQSSRKAEFNQLIEDQLKLGRFKMRRTTIELDDLSELEDAGVDAQGNKITREKKARVAATEIVLDKDGKPIVVQKSPLHQYDLKINQFSITETEYDAATQKQFAAKKDSYLNAEKSKAQRQEEVQQRLMVEEKGRRQAAEITAEENQKKVRAEIQAEQAAAVAKINKDKAVTEAQQRTEVAKQLKLEADTLRDIAGVEAATAELHKKAAISAAEAKQKSLDLGGGFSEKDRGLAEIAAQRDIGVATALSNVRVPTTVIGGGSAGAGGEGNLLNLALLKYMGVLKDPPAVAGAPSK
jgi:hypothetical protein